jgi:transketolase
MTLNALSDLRKQIITASSLSNEGHIPSAFSILEILYTIYVLIPAKFNLVFDKDFDFVLSKGHGSLALYAVLNASGMIEDGWVNDFCKNNSNYGGHPDRTKVNGVVASTGSLGHGLPITIGRILANRMKQIKNRSYCLVGDGELNEGSNWESIILAENLNLEELCLIVDLNNSTLRSISVLNLRRKLESFGFEVYVVDGHDLERLETVLSMPLRKSPIAIIAETIKGKGLKDMENSFYWHHRSPDKTQLTKFIGEVE